MQWAEEGLVHCLANGCEVSCNHHQLMHYYLQSLMHHPFVVTTIYNALFPQGQVKPRICELESHTGGWNIVY